MIKQDVAEPRLTVQWTYVCSEQSVCGGEVCVCVWAGADLLSCAVTRLRLLVISH